MRERRFGVRVLCTLVGVLVAAASAPGGSIDPGLEQILASTPDDEVVSALVYLKDRVDVMALNAQLGVERVERSARHEIVLRALKDKARLTQVALDDHLAALERGGHVQDYAKFWLANAMRVDTTPAVLRELAQHPDVDVIYPNYPIELIEPVETRPAPPTGPSVEPGLVAIRAPEVWDMGITGAGVIVATIDSGVDADHPALYRHWAGVADPRYIDHPEWAWYDALYSTSYPQDLYSHGTHTMGTVCGEVPGEIIGVAPGAYWISACSLAPSTGRFVDNCIVCLQWIADPDGDPATFWDVPRTCSNSWGLGDGDVVPTCDERFWSFIDACEAAGTVMVFAAGNDAYFSFGRPADRATTAYNACAIGAVDANTPGWPIAEFSSRGPTDCTPDGSLAIKPDLSAPGVDVRSSIPGGDYMLASGTSMAAPHVNGVLALMYEACPYLTVDEAKQILYETAVDLGEPGEDNDYGWGMIDALAAVNRALEVCSPRPPYAWPAEYETDTNEPLTITLRVTDDGQPDPPGTVDLVIAELPGHGTLRDPGADVITAVPYVLVGGGDQVIYRPDPYYRGPDSFSFVANDGGEPPAGGDSNVAAVTLTVGLPCVLYFEPLAEDPGWSTECEWEFGQPLGLGGDDWGWPDPDCGAVGLNVYGVNLEGDYYFRPSGQCCLTTPPLDFTNAWDVTLRFQRWLNTDSMIRAMTWIAVTNDGETWHDLWHNGLWAYNDNMWRPWEYDISEFADGQPSVQVRWCYQTHPMVMPMSGWNIDEIEFRGMLPVEWIPGDLDGDADVDGDDLAIFADCLTGPANPLGGTCGLTDLDGDGDCDLADFVRFQQACAGQPH
ncbi:MAG: S8 family serine peptidase [Phycisphaerae bacterium]|jgi:bacillopeptidase F